MADELIYIPNYDSQNYLFCRLKLLVETFEHSTLLTKQSKFTEVPKISKQTNKKTFYKTLGTSVINAHCPLSETYYSCATYRNNYPWKYINLIFITFNLSLVIYKKK